MGFDERDTGPTRPRGLRWGAGFAVLVTYHALALTASSVLSLVVPRYRKVVGFQVTYLRDTVSDVISRGQG